MNEHAPNGNGKISLQNLGVIAGLVGAFWMLIQGENGHVREKIATLESEQQRMELRLNQQKSELDTGLQREMRTLNEVIKRDVEGNDRLSLDRHNFQEMELRDLKDRIKQLESKP